MQLEKIKNSYLYFNGKKYEFYSLWISTFITSVIIITFIFFYRLLESIKSLEKSLHSLNLELKKSLKNNDYNISKLNKSIIDLNNNITTKIDNSIAQMSNNITTKIDNSIAKINSDELEVKNEIVSFLNMNQINFSNPVYKYAIVSILTLGLLSGGYFIYSSPKFSFASFLYKYTVPSYIKSTLTSLGLVSEIRIIDITDNDNIIRCILKNDTVDKVLIKNKMDEGFTSIFDYLNDINLMISTSTVESTGNLPESLNILNSILI